MKLTTGLLVPYRGRPATFVNEVTSKMQALLAPYLAQIGTCLILEDDSLIRLDLEDTLRQLGITEIESAATVAQGLHLAQHHEFGLAILDFALGPHTSIELAARLITAGAAVLFVSGYGDGIDLPQALAQTPVLSKPFTTQMLADAIVATFEARKKLVSP